MTKKIVSLFLTSALCAVLLTGCIGNFYENAMVVDGENVSSGLYLMLQYSAYNEAEAKLEEVKDKNGDLVEQNVLKEQVEGKKGKEWVTQRTEDLARRFVYVERECLEKEMVLSEDNSNYLQQTMGYWESLAPSYAAQGVSQKTFMSYLANESLGTQLFDEMYGEEGELTPPAADIKKEYAEKFAHMKSISIPVSANDEEQTDKTAEVEKFAKKMQKTLEGGKTLDEIATENLSEIYGVLGREFDAETTQNHVSESDIAFEKEEDDETYTQEFLDELKTQKNGEFGVYVMPSTVLLYEKTEMFADDEAFEAKRKTVVKELYSEAFDEYLKEKYSGYELSRPFGSQNYFRAEKIAKIEKANA